MGFKERSDDGETQSETVGFGGVADLSDALDGFVGKCRTVVENPDPGVAAGFMKTDFDEGIIDSLDDSRCVLDQIEHDQFDLKTVGINKDAG